MQSVLDSITNVYPVFRTLLSSFPFPIIDFFYSIASVLLLLVVVKVIIKAI